MAGTCFPALAGGLYLSELGTPGSLGTAGVANVTNDFGADSAFTNPAGMVGLDQDTLLSGLQLALPSIEFGADIAEGGGISRDNAGLYTAAPSTFYVKVVSERLRLGISSTGLLGGGTDFGNSSPGRYAANRVSLAGLGLSPSFAYQISDRLSVGAGVSIIYTILNQDISIRQPLGLPDAEVRFDRVDGIAPQGFFGLQYRFGNDALFGLVYRTKSSVDIEGDVDFANLAIPVEPIDEIDISWDYPQLVEIGVRVPLNDRWNLIANADWEDWSEFSNNRLAFTGNVIARAVSLDRNFKDTWHLGVGAIYRTGTHNFGFGLSYDSSPVDDADRTMDLALDEQIKVSVGYQQTRPGQFDFGLGLTMIYAGEAAVDQTAQGVRFRGEFDDNLITLVGGTLRWEF